jgi:hypothetical protein
MKSTLVRFQTVCSSAIIAITHYVFVQIIFFAEPIATTCKMLYGKEG